MALLGCCAGGERGKGLGYLRWVTYLFIIDDDAITVRDVDTKSGSEPALPENAIDPGEGNWFSEVFFSDANSLAFRLSQGALVVPVLGFVDAELFRVSHFLTF